MVKNEDYCLRDWFLWRLPREPGARSPIADIKRRIESLSYGSSWNRVDKFDGLKGHRARYLADILHFC
jgi:hypothetical protein